MFPSPPSLLCPSFIPLPHKKFEPQCIMAAGQSDISETFLGQETAFLSPVILQVGTFLFGRVISRNES